MPRSVVLAKSGFELGGLRRTPDGPHRKLSIAERRKSGKPDFVSHMARGFDLEGRVLLAPDRPAAGIAIRVPLVARTRINKNSSTGAILDLTFFTDRSGKFVIPGIGKDDSPLIQAFLNGRSILALPKAWRQGLAGQVLLGCAHAETPKQIYTLSKISPLELQVLTPDRGPAIDANIVFKLTGNAELNFRTNRAGRVRFLIPAAQTVRMGIRHTSGFRMCHLRKERGAADATPAIVKHTIRLIPGLAIRGRAVDKDGEGMAGETVYLSAQWPRTAGTVPSSFFENAGAETPPVQIRDIRHPRILYQMMRSLVPPLLTKADGRFVARLPNTELRFQASCHFNGPSGWEKAEKFFELKEGEMDPIELQFDGYSAAGTRAAEKKKSANAKDGARK